MRALSGLILYFVVLHLFGVEGTVTASKLNVRVRPNTRYEVVARLDKGDKVNVLEHDSDWYRIESPSGTKVFVAKSFVEGGRVVKEAHLRAGPSVAFTSYRLASAGEPVKVVDDAREDWVQVEVPKDITVWVNAQYIYVTPENAAKLTAKPTEAPVAERLSEKAPSVTNEPERASVPSVVPAEGEALPFTDDKGRTVSVDGTVLPLKDSVYVTHAVAVKVAGEFFPLCYIRSEKHDLKDFERMHVNVIGTQRWVKNWKRPVVDVEKIRQSH
ncbi:MAG: SH3 domain-containing protein [Victivallales bacterium]|nr:SH3 domain-containing protein [Victivallales bacterium]